MPDAAPLRVDLLGEFRLFHKGENLRLRGRKARALLAYLACAPNRTLSRERAADLLWSDRGPDQARASLRQTIAEIRSGLPVSDAIIVNRDTIAFAAGQASSDVDAIIEACASGDAPALAEGLDQAGDMFLADMSGLSPAFDDWLLAERVRQHERLISAAVEAVEPMMASARPIDVQTILRGLERLDPWNEAVARLGLEADFAAGDAAALHRRYRRLAECLQLEFGTTPSEETRALFERLRAAQPDKSPAPKLVTAGDAAAPAAAVTPPTILVSPIEAMSPTGEAAEIAAIVTDDIRTALAQHSELRVLSLESASLERVESLCKGSISTYMLSGRIRQLGGEIRVNLLIGNAETSVVVWSHQFQLDRQNLAEAVDLVVARAVGAAYPAIDRDLAATISSQPENERDLVHRYIRARRLIAHGRTLGDVQNGVATLEGLIDEDPRHLNARLLLARMYNTDFWQRLAGHDVAAFRARALALANEAATIEPADIRLQLRLGWCNLRERNWWRAERHFHKALGAITYDADALNECAFGLCHLGELDEAEPVLQRAFTLNPFAPGDYHADYATLLALRGDTVAAEEHFEVSGEQGLQYLAVRLANLIRHPRDHSAQRAKIAATFTAGFHAAWQPSLPPKLGDVSAWLRDTLPFRQEAHAQMLEDGLLAAVGADFAA
ncbi:MAG TPA: BTAD domain-containing putative transcriptional regulator [Sphingomonas sp.]|nr:BTAD domain-containing putative transcriptional regulator [Sphingomonas sp.]